MSSLNWVSRPVTYVVMAAASAACFPGVDGSSQGKGAPILPTSRVAQQDECVDGMLSTAASIVSTWEGAGLRIRVAEGAAGSEGGLALDAYLESVAAGVLPPGTSEQVLQEILGEARAFCLRGGAKRAWGSEGQRFELESAMFACRILIISQGLGSGGDMLNPGATAQYVIDQLEGLLVARSVPEVDKCAIRAKLREFYRSLESQGWALGIGGGEEIHFAPHCLPIFSMPVTQTPLWQKLLPLLDRPSELSFDTVQSEFIRSQGIGTVELDRSSGVLTMTFLSTRKPSQVVPLEDFEAVNCVPVSFEQMGDGSIVVAGTCPTTLSGILVRVDFEVGAAPRVTPYPTPRFVDFIVPTAIVELPRGLGVAVLDRYLGSVVFLFPDRGVSVEAIKRADFPELDELCFIRSSVVQRGGVDSGGYVVTVSSKALASTGVFPEEKISRLEIYDYEGDGVVDDVRSVGAQ